jgi:CPA1 family monovalent cation:H+ antiporter
VIHHVETQVLIMLLVAAIVGMGARWLRIPYTLALVLAGLMLGFADLPALSGIELSADLLLLLLLPALLFEAAFHIEWPDFRRDAVPILMLAVVGVIIAVTATAGLLYLGLGHSGMVSGFGWEHALLFAAVIAATDPISVLALFKELGVTRRLYLLVEGESLLNDGVAVVVFTIVLAVVGISVGGVAPPVLETTGDIVSYSLTTFVRMAFGGALVGALIGGAMSAVTRQVDDHLIEITLTTLVAYGSFLVAEQLHCSGVLSTVVAGVFMGSIGAKKGMSPLTKKAVEDFWEYMAFLANSFIFLLIGLELDPGELAKNIPAIGVGFAAVVGGRALAIYGVMPFANRVIVDRLPRKWSHVLVWGGLRGSLSMVLILTLPADFPGRSFLVTLVFGVVGTSLFLQGLTMQPLLRFLGMMADDEHSEYARARARALALRAAIEEIDSLERRGIISRAAKATLEARYEHLLDGAEHDAAAHAGATELDEQLIEGSQRLALVERTTLRKLARGGLLDAHAAAELEADILARLSEQKVADEALGGADDVR